MKYGSHKHSERLLEMLNHALPAEFKLDIGDEEPVYSLDVVSHLVGLPVWTLRTIVKEGIVKPKVKSKKKTYFCMNDLKLIEYARYLMEVKGVNIRGIRMIIEMQGGSEE